MRHNINLESCLKISISSRSLHYHRRTSHRPLLPCRPSRILKLLPRGSILQCHRCLFPPMKCDLSTQAPPSLRAFSLLFRFQGLCRHSFDPFLLCISRSTFSYKIHYPISGSLAKEAHHESMRLMAAHRGNNLACLLLSQVVPLVTYLSVIDSFVFLPKIPEDQKYEALLCREVLQISEQVSMIIEGSSAGAEIKLVTMRLLFKLQPAITARMRSRLIQVDEDLGVTEGTSTAVADSLASVH